MSHNTKPVFLAFHFSCYSRSGFRRKCRRSPRGEELIRTDRDYIAISGLHMKRRRGGVNKKHQALELYYMLAINYQSHSLRCLEITRRRLLDDD